jgi:hypothetical protein
LTVGTEVAFQNNLGVVGGENHDATQVAFQMERNEAGVDAGPGHAIWAVGSYDDGGKFRPMLVSRGELIARGGGKTRHD